MSLDLLPALRSAVIGIDGLPALVSQWKGEPAVFTRRPTPADAIDPMVLINTASAIGDGDGLNSDRPIVTHDIAVYGHKGPPGDAGDQTRDVDAIAYKIRAHFHRNRFSMQPAGYHVIGVVARGPFAGPVDDESTVARIVSVIVSLRRQG